MIIDTHTHFYDPFRPQGVPWPPADNALLYRTVLPAHCKAVAQPEGVTGTVVVEASAWLADNQWILDLAADEPFIVGFVGRVEPNQPDFGETIEELARNRLFRGIRCNGNALAQLDEAGFMRDMGQLAALDLALDALVRDEHFDHVLHLADRVPDLRIIINHIGSMPLNGAEPTPDWVERFRLAAQRPNIFLKVSALMENSVIQPAPGDVKFYRPALDLFWSTFGAERLIYGSNWPVCERAGDYATCIDIVRTYFAAKGQQASENYFWRNAKSAYKWIDRP
ncbi:MAG: amidohydrolase family protein [Caldilineaceae bacterium]|nr:amidohydrolase family protein [Caldilineaceae bacterium]